MQFRLSFTLTLFLVSNLCDGFVDFLQAARSGLEKCQAKVNSASSEEEKADAQIGVELYETLLKALEG